MKIKDVLNDPALHFIYCPACESYHPFRVGDPKKGFWEWDGNRISPTIGGSLFTNRDGSAPVPKCHLHVTDGKIIYLPDCSHDLAGQTVDLPDFPE
jgi:hypothetical protein